MERELASFNSFTEQTSRYLTPFELEVFGHGHIDGDQTTAEIVSLHPNDQEVVFEANTFRRENSRVSGVPFIFEPTTLLPLLKQGYKTQLEVHPLDTTGHADTITLRVVKDGHSVQVDTLPPLQLRNDKADHIALEAIGDSIMLHPIVQGAEISPEI